MLNITDVRKRLAVNKEPSEVEEIREKILTSFNDLEFIEDGHKYYLHNGDGSTTELKSVSATIQEFVPNVDWNEKAENCALKEGVDVSVIKRRWEENNLRATSNGTSIHLFGEMYHWFVTDHTEKFDPVIKPQYEKGYLIPLGEKENASQKYNEDLFNVHDMYPLMVETQIYTKKYAGTFDKLIYYKHPTNDEKSGLIIADYKGLPLDTPIATEDGWITMGNIKKGDKIFDKNGSLTTVIGVSDIHYNPCLKIMFDNNDSIICDEDHRWLISFKQREKIIEKVMTAQELYQYLKQVHRNKKGYIDSYLQPKIYNSKPLHMAYKILPIDPYVLGLWLGDGNQYSGHITNMYNEIWSEIEKRGYILGKDVSQNRCGNAVTRCVYGLSSNLKKLNLLHNKHIPDSYLRSSYEQRFQILQGLMDTDGYYNATRKRYVFVTTRKKQAKMCYILLSSLGIKAKLIKTWTRYTNCKNKNKHVCYNVTYWTDVYPFLIRKIKIPKHKQNKYNFRIIKKIEKVETIPTRCIEVDSPSHTYCCGYNMLVTHNTNHSLISDYNRKYNVTMLSPFNDLVDEALSHYTLQLSLYQIPLENLGFKILARRIIWLKSDGTYEQIPVPNMTKRLRETLDI